MDKRILKQITKRWIKGIIMANEAQVSFMDSKLTEEECAYIQKCSDEIAEKITDMQVIFDVDELVSLYYENES